MAEVIWTIKAVEQVKHKVMIATELGCPLGNVQAVAPGGQARPVELVQAHVVGNDHLFRREEAVAAGKDRQVHCLPAPAFP